MAAEEALSRLDEPVHAFRTPEGEIGFATNGECRPGTPASGGGWLPLLGWAPPLTPADLGDRAFLEEHGVRFPYIAGALASGIASTRMVVEMGRAGMLGFFGAAGLEIPVVEAAVRTIHEELGPGAAWGANLIHMPLEPDREMATAELFVRSGVPSICASAFMKVTPAVVYARAKGLTRRPDGRIAGPRRILAKLSRPELAREFVAPASGAILEALVAQGRLTAAECELARRVPLAGDVTIEGDSGGHTDNRPVLPLLAAVQETAARAAAEHGWARPPRVGAAGGVGTPIEATALFAAGAAYVLTGSINQACVEAGTSDLVKEMLARAELADADMAPAADMFELGVRVQVLKRGTLFAARARRLGELYRAYDSLESIPTEERANLETRIFRQPIESVWRETEAYFARRDPILVEKARANAKQRMALVFRWYLGLSSRWAIQGVADRSVDFQVWCGPAMGAFNQWVRETFLADPRERRVALVARNILHGAAAIARARILAVQGVPLPPSAFRFAPRRFDELR